MGTPLSYEEDAELRRLAALAAFGELGESAAALYEDLRARDRRESIREPQDLVVPGPKQPAEDGPLAASPH